MHRSLLNRERASCYTLGTSQAMLCIYFFCTKCNQTQGQKGVGCATLGFGVRVSTSPMYRHTTKLCPPCPACHIELHMNGCGGWCYALLQCGYRSLRNLCCIHQKRRDCASIQCTVWHLHIPFLYCWNVLAQAQVEVPPPKWSALECYGSQWGFTSPARVDWDGAQPPPTTGKFNTLLQGPRWCARGGG